MRDLGYDQTDVRARGHCYSPNRKILSRSVNGASALWSDHGGETLTDQDVIHQASEGVGVDAEDWERCFALMLR